MSSAPYTPTRFGAPMQPGERYGQVVTVEHLARRLWRCRCDCGRTFDTWTTHLRSGVTTSCGHWRAERDPDSYNAIHLRTVRERGPASDHLCVDCGEGATDWSYNRSGVGEKVGTRGGYALTYSSDPTQYEPRCKRCHWHKDHGPEVRNG